MTNWTDDFVTPGTQATLLFERTEVGRLVALRAGERVYLKEEGGLRVFDGGLAVIRDVPFPNGCLRHVSAAGETWVEEYLWDSRGRPSRVDGMTIDRDADNRITACIGQGVEWHYGYTGNLLVVIEGPHGTRHITHGVNGRPVAWRERERTRRLSYLETGRRADASGPPSNWHCDELGRLWTITAPDGSVQTTFLWDGFACLGRIDGPPGDPLAAVFSLDLSCTPVRVVTRKGVERIPRDAFGEMLLRQTGIPGLYCGAIFDGLVYFRARVLDPVTGAFDRPDPFHGLNDDPRRTDGYNGKLLVEAGGAYAVCQNEPVGRIDPTGEISVPLLLSDFTWSIQNNLAGWFGMDFTLNFWIDLLSFNAGGLLGRFFSFEGLESKRSGSFGVRRDGVFTGSRAFTFQHEVWNSASIFDRNFAQVFDPKGAFSPTLYGTLLRGVPTGGGAPFLLTGNLDPNSSPMDWTRHGGKAEPVVPGAVVAQFPSGGLHFDVASTTLVSKTSCTMTELTASPTMVTATAASATATIDVPGSSVSLNAGDLVLLTDGASKADIKKVLTVTSQGSNTRIRLEDANLAVAASGVRLRGLNAPAPPPPSPDTLSAIGPAGRLNIASSAVGYAVNDAVLMSQAGTKVGAGLVSALEAQLQTDGAIPSGFTAPLNVRATIAGAATAGTLGGNILTVATGPLPAPGDAIVLSGGGGLWLQESPGRPPRHSGSWIVPRPNLLRSAAPSTGSRSLPEYH